MTRIGAPSRLSSLQEPLPPDACRCPDIDSSSALLDAKARRVLDPENPPLNVLPSDILRQIASQLDPLSKSALALYSKYLKGIVRHTQTSVKVPGFELADALKAFPNTGRVTVTGLLWERDIAKIPDLSKVKHLDLSGCRQLTDAAITLLLQKFPNLTSLDLSHCCLLSDAAIILLLQKFPNLTSLNLSGCNQLTNAAITVLAENCRNLTSLDLSGCRQLTNAAITVLAKNCRNLTSLNLNLNKGQYQYLRHNYGLTDAAILALADKCPDLTDLNLSNCWALTDAAVTALAENCRNLSHLNLSGCKGLTDALIRALAQGCRKLTSLDLSECNRIADAAITAIRQAYPNLKVTH